MPVLSAEYRVRGRLEQHGLTLVELLVVIAIISILATAVMPLSRMTMTRVKETELRSGLRILRSAIDAFNKDCVTKNCPVTTAARTVTRSLWNFSRSRSSSRGPVTRPKSISGGYPGTPLPPLR